MGVTLPQANRHLRGRKSVLSCSDESDVEWIGVGPHNIYFFSTVIAMCACTVQDRQCHAVFGWIQMSTLWTSGMVGSDWPPNQEPSLCLVNRLNNVSSGCLPDNLRSKNWWWRDLKQKEVNEKCLIIWPPSAYRIHQHKLCFLPQMFAKIYLKWQHCLFSSIQ